MSFLLAAWPAFPENQVFRGADVSDLSPPWNLILLLEMTAYTSVRIQEAFPIVSVTK